MFLQPIKNHLKIIYRSRTMQRPMWFKRQMITNKILDHLKTSNKFKNVINIVFTI